MNSINNQTLIHVGIELLVVASLAFWVNKKDSNLQAQINKLVEQNENFEKIMIEQRNLIMKHEQMLMQIFNPNRQISPPQYQTQNTQTQIQPQTENKTTVPEVQPEEEPDIDLSEIDRILDLETNPKEIEIECVDDVCVIKTKPKKKKKRLAKKKQNG